MTMTEQEQKEIAKKLYRIKHYIFKNTIAKIDYLKIERTTGEKIPFYREICELHEIIERLKGYKDDE